MPKPRKTAQPQTLFSVSPWQSKSDKRTDAATSEETDYTVVHEELIKTSSSPKHPSKVDSRHQQPDQGIKSQSPATAAAVGGWRTKVVQQDEQIEQGYDLNEDPKIGVLAQHFNLAKTSLQPAAPLLEDKDITPRPAALTTTPPISLAGSAFLVLLGGSRILGNITLLAHPSVTYPLHGREVTSYRECTRDPEWSLIKLYLLNLPSSELPRELVIVAERTGGDAMKLRSPVQWQGDEMEVFAEEQMDHLLDGGSGGNNVEGLELEFECHSLLADAAADAELAKVMPGAVGMDAMINIGPMKLTWKKSLV